MIKSITSKQIEKARRVLDSHTVDPLTREGAFECGLWRIASQATPWETACRFVYNLRDKSRQGDKNSRWKYSTLDVLTDSTKVDAASEKAGWRFANMGRFDQFIDFFGRLEGNWWQSVREADQELRRKHTAAVKWLNNKTYSFWHICLGGRNLLALDVYVMRGLKELGVSIKEDYVVPKSRSIGKQRVRKTPVRKDYMCIEEEARKLFQDDERFLKDGEVDLGLVDAVLWWGRANRDQHQGCLLSGDRSEIILPYAEIRM